MNAAPVGCERLSAPPPFEVWRIDLRGLPVAADEIDSLSAEEWARARRFAFDLHRSRYLGAHRAMRQLLAARAGLPAGTLQFGFGVHGKPHLEVPCGTPAFNLSDSEDVALLAMAPKGDIGVDIEVLRTVSDAMELAELHFTAVERAELATAVDAAARDRRFLVGWTRKEACLKAIGSGLSIGANTFDAGLDERPRRIGIPVGSMVAWVDVQSLSVGPDCVAALAQRIERAAA